MAFRFRFCRIGGLDQVALDGGADLAHLHELDQKLWVALSCPVKGLELEERTLEMLDLDKDGRVRATEVLAALRWCAERLKDLGALIPGARRFAARRDRRDETRGEGIARSGTADPRQARDPDATSLTVADVADVSRVFEGTRFNGDGVIPEDAAEAPELRQVIAEAIDCVGGCPTLRQGGDRSGQARRVLWRAVQLRAVARRGDPNADAAAVYEATRASG